MVANSTNVEMATPNENLVDVPLNADPEKATASTPAAVTQSTPHILLLIVLPAELAMCSMVVFIILISLLCDNPDHLYERGGRLAMYMMPVIFYLAICFMLFIIKGGFVYPMPSAKEERRAFREELRGFLRDLLKAHGVDKKRERFELHVFGVLYRIERSWPEKPISAIWSFLMAAFYTSTMPCGYVVLVALEWNDKMISMTIDSWKRGDLELWRKVSDTFAFTTIVVATIVCLCLGIKQCKELALEARLRQVEELIKEDIENASAQQKGEVEEPGVADNTIKDQWLKDLWGSWKDDDTDEDLEKSWKRYCEAMDKHLGKNNSSESSV